MVKEKQLTKDKEKVARLYCIKKQKISGPRRQKIWFAVLALRANQKWQGWLP
jgi:hypothetical protein